MTHFDAVLHSLPLSINEGKKLPAVKVIEWKRLPAVKVIEWKRLPAVKVRVEEITSCKSHITPISLTDKKVSTQILSLQ